MAKDKVYHTLATLRHGYPPVNLLHIFRPPFRKDSPGGLLLT